MTSQCELSSKQAKNTCKQNHKESTFLGTHNDHPGRSENRAAFTGYGCVVLSLHRSSAPEHNEVSAGAVIQRGGVNTATEMTLSCVYSLPTEAGALHGWWKMLVLTAVSSVVQRMGRDAMIVKE